MRSQARRDGTQIQLTILYQLALAGGKLPLRTRNGLMFRLALHGRTLERAVKELERQGLVERCMQPTPRGEVQALRLNDEVVQQITRALSLFNVLT